MADPQFLFRDEAASAPVVALSAFGEDTNSTAVRIEPGEDARLLLDHLDRLSLVEVSFPPSPTGAASPRPASCARRATPVNCAPWAISAWTC